jgi:hypothetical protein
VIDVEGGRHYRQVARAVRAAGDRELSRALARGLASATKPLKDAGRASASACLPRRGGLARHVAEAKWTTRRSTGRAPGVSITVRRPKPGGTGAVDLPSMDRRGLVRHPAWGDRSRWYSQHVTPGWFTRPMRAAGPRAAREIRTQLDQITQQIIRRTR